VLVEQGLTLEGADRVHGEDLVFAEITRPTHEVLRYANRGARTVSVREVSRVRAGYGSESVDDRVRTGVVLGDCAPGSAVGVNRLRFDIHRVCAAIVHLSDGALRVHGQARDRVRSSVVQREARVTSSQVDRLTEEG